MIVVVQPGRRLRRAAAIFTLLTSTSVTAFAQSPATPAASTDPTREAAQRFAAASQAFVRGDFRVAGNEFDAAYKLVPHQDALWNAAQAWESAGELARAANRYETYLTTTSATAPGRAQATRAVAKLAQRLGRVHVLGLVGELASVDGEAMQGDVAYVYPGTHHVTIQRNGSAISREVSIAAQEDRSVSFGAPDECVAAADAGQKLGDRGKLTAALEQFRVCSAARCPQGVASDCRRWLEEVNDRLPSVLFDVRAPEGRELHDVRVLVDDTVLTASLDGKALAIDPGPHTLHFDAAGHQPSSLDVVLKEGEKLRRLKVDLALASAKREGIDKSVERSSSKTPIFVLGGIGIAGIATFGVLGAMGQSTKDNLASSCAPHGTCDEGQVSGVKTKLLVADVALGVGVVALGVGVYFLVRELNTPARVRR